MNQQHTVAEIKKLKPEFAQKYIVSLQGKEFVLYNGLILLAKEKGLKTFQTRIIDFPRPENDHTAICETTVVGYEVIDGEKVEVQYSELGDANAGNCNKMVGKHFIRMAATRSKGRALRDFLGIDAVMFEELGDGVFETNDPSKKQINKGQVNQIVNIKTELGWSAEETKTFSVATTGEGDIMKYTEADANNLINALKLELGRAPKVAV